MSAGQLWREHITPKQAEVAELVHQGLSDGEIAGRLDKSRGGVQYLMREINDRLGTTNRLQVAMWWEKEVLVAMPKGWEGSD